MLIFGVSIILCFIAVIAYLVILFNFMFLIFCWPILVGIWMGIFKKSDKGYEIELKNEDAKKLHNIIQKVTSKTGLKKPYKIILSEGSEVAVTGLYKKKLIIGLATLQLLDENDLLAIIAHEYGHFAKKDTVFGYFTYRIQHFFELQREINKQNLDFSYSIVVYFPTWLFFLILSKYYALISLWYSRKVEFRADNFASELVGKQKFGNALVKYCMISEIFENILPQHILHFLKENKQLVNIYDYMLPLYTENNLKISFKEVMAAKSSWWSTHPSISERLEALEIKSVNISINKKLKDFFNNQKEYEKEASEVMTHKMAYWHHLVAAQDSSSDEYEEQDDETDDYAFFCTKCGNRVNDDDIKCKNCKSLLAAEGACERRDFK